VAVKFHQDLYEMPILAMVDVNITLTLKKNKSMVEIIKKKFNLGFNTVSNE